MNLPRSVAGFFRARSTHRTSARGAELADALDSGSSSRKGGGGRVLSRAPYFAFHAFLTAASTVSAFSAPSGVSSCLKYTNTSPALASFAILSSSALRSFAEYFSLRSRKYAKSAVCTSGVSSFSLSALHSAAFAPRSTLYTSSLNQDSWRNSKAVRNDLGSVLKKFFSKSTSHFRNGGS